MTGTPRLVARLLGLGAIALVAVAIAVVLVGGEEDRYRSPASSATRASSIGGELVVVGGVEAGSVERIELSDDNRALVTFTVDEEFAPLRARHRRDRSLDLARRDRQPSRRARPCRPAAKAATRSRTAAR